MGAVRSGRYSIWLPHILHLKKWEVGDIVVTKEISDLLNKKRYKWTPSLKRIGQILSQSPNFERIGYRGNPGCIHYKFVGGGEVND